MGGVEQRRKRLARFNLEMHHKKAEAMFKKSRVNVMVEIPQLSPICARFPS